jgi:hypothetical protein
MTMVERRKYSRGVGSDVKSEMHRYGAARVKGGRRQNNGDSSGYRRARNPGASTNLPCVRCWAIRTEYTREACPTAPKLRKLSSWN